jgi:hypothetical protein
MSQEKSGLAVAGLAALAALLAGLPYRVERLWFNQQQVSLDGYRFVGCRFDNCTLRTTRGTFVFENCYVGPNCTIEFLGEASKVVRLYTLVAPQANQEARTNWPVLAPEYASDGTFTIR